MTQIPSSRLLAYAAAGCLLSYAALTSATFLPDMGERSGGGLLALAKHLFVLTGIAVFLRVRPKMGSDCLQSPGVSSFPVGST